MPRNWYGALATLLVLTSAGGIAFGHNNSCQTTQAFSTLGSSPTDFSTPGYRFSPAKAGETFSVYASGFGPTSIPVVSGATTQGGVLSPLPVITIGGKNATVTFAGLAFPGRFQINVTVPSPLEDGDQPIKATYGGATTQSGALLSVHQ